MIQNIDKFLDQIAQNINAVDERVHPTSGTRFYRLKEIDDRPICLKLNNIPVGTFCGINKVGVVIGTLRTKSPEIVNTIDQIRNIIYGKLKNIIHIPAPAEHQSYNIRFFCPDKISGVVHYNNHPYDIPFDIFVQIIKNCTVSMDIHLRELMVGADDFTVNLYITNMVINNIPEKPETIRLITLLNRKQLDDIEQYIEMENGDRRDKYVSKKEIHNNIMKILERL